MTEYLLIADTGQYATSLKVRCSDKEIPLIIELMQEAYGDRGLQVDLQAWEIN